MRIGGTGFPQEGVGVIRRGTGVRTGGTGFPSKGRGPLGHVTGTETEGRFVPAKGEGSLRRGPGVTIAGKASPPIRDAVGLTGLRKRSGIEVEQRGIETKREDAPGFGAAPLAEPADASGAGVDVSAGTEVVAFSGPSQPEPVAKDAEDTDHELEAAVIAAIWGDAKPGPTVARAALAPVIDLTTRQRRPA